MDLFKDTYGNRKKKATQKSQKTTAKQLHKKQTYFDAFNKANKEVKKNV